MVLLHAIASATRGTDPAALVAALIGLDLEYCATPRIARGLPVIDSILRS